jgi:hypothetical protein
LIEALAPKALDPKNPSSKPRQTLFDYALWHGQHQWIADLGRAGFAAAKGLMDDGEFWGAGTVRPNRYDLHNPAGETLQGLIRKTVAAGRQRHLQPWQARNFKDLLRQADSHGPDHATVVGATPLMLAASAGNAALVQALLDKGAEPTQRDEFGHTAWDMALGRAMQDTAFAKTGLAAIFELLAPQALDVQTGGRLVRLERKQGEYWVLMLMLAGLKTQWSRCITRKVEPWKYPAGLFADQLHEVLAELPAWLWADKRRKRSYVNQVLARAEVGSSYQPARRLWVRARNGHYLPNPAMALRQGESWTPVYDGWRSTDRRGCGEGGDVLGQRPWRR